MPIRKAKKAYRDPDHQARAAQPIGDIAERAGGDQLGERAQRRQIADLHQAQAAIGEPDRPIGQADAAAGEKRGEAQTQADPRTQSDPHFHAPPLFMSAFKV
jgi:hypothetical protein